MRPPSPNPLPTPRPGPNPVGLPPKVLASLAAGVVIAHAVVLQLAGNAMEAQSPLLTRPFITRAVAVSRTAPNAAPDTTTKATATSPTALAAAPAAATTAAPPAAPPRPRKRVVTQLDAQALAGASAQQNSALPPLDTAPTAPPSVPESAAPTPTEAAAAVALEPAASAAAPAVSADPVTLAAAPSSGPAPGPPSASAPAPTSAPPSASTPASTPASPPATPTATPSAAKPPAAAVAFTVPGSVRLRYKTVAQVGGLNWDVSGELLWLQDGTSYNARLQWTLFGVSKVLTSTGRIGSDGLLPTRFGDKFRSSEVAAHFERDKQKVVFSANTPELPLLAGMQDQLSVFVQMGAMLGAAPAKFPRGSQLAFETVGPRAADTWVFVVDAEEKLSLPGGEMATLKLVRGARREFDQTAELWLAPSLGYLPVRLKISERNGDFVDQQWRSSETP